MEQANHSTDSHPTRPLSGAFCKGIALALKRDLHLSPRGGLNHAQQPPFIIGSFVHWVIYTQCGVKAGALRTVCLLSPNCIGWSRMGILAFITYPVTLTPKKCWCELQLCVTSRSMECDARTLGSAVSLPGQKDLPYLFLITWPWQAINI